MQFLTEKVKNCHAFKETKVSPGRQFPLYLLSHGLARTFSYKVSEKSGVGRYLTLGGWNLFRKVRKLQFRALFGPELKNLDSATLLEKI
jgi:hypothetical protein